jgi:uncharacterized repeat protein (TIGR01451 family)
MQKLKGFSALAGRLVMIFMILHGISINASLMAAELLAPVTPGLFFQANGPQTERNNGDWWTNKNGGDSLQVFEIVVPVTADPHFTLTVDLYDPECFNSGLDERDKRGDNKWDNTLFKLYPPTGSTPIIEKTYTPTSVTAKTWVTLASFKISKYGHGIYHLYTRTMVDDENYFRIRIPENDPDGKPLSGDEIQVRAWKTTLQFPAGGSTTLWFYIPPRTPVLNLFNFDMENSTLTPKYIIFNPLWNSFPGTISADDRWNTGSISLPTTGVDQFNNPMAGWWHVDLSLAIENQIIFYGIPWTDQPPEIFTAIGDYLWNDADADGIQDFNENGMPGITVNLLDSLGTTIASQLTGPNGGFLFANLVPRHYQLEFKLPFEYQFTAQHQGGNENLDSDVDPLTGRTALFSLLKNEIQLSLDAGAMRRDVADLDIEKIVDATDIMTGDTAQYTLTITNLGPDPATHVKVIENIPTGIQFISATPPQTSGPVPVEWDIATLDSGQSAIIHFMARVTSLQQGRIINTATVTSDNPDPDSSNNSDSASIDVFVSVELSSFTAHVENDAVRLEWVTQSESESMGFYLYRKESREQEFQKITSSPIPAAGNSQVARHYEYMDKVDLSPSNSYSYQLADIGFNGKITVHDAIAVTTSAPQSYELKQNFPNPFNMSTTIRFQLRQSDNVELLIYNMKGQLVRTLVKGHLEAGVHEMLWDGCDNSGQIVPSGNYIYSLKVNDFEQVQKMILVK